MKSSRLDQAIGPLSESERAAIFGGNGRSVYGLTEPAEAADRRDLCTRDGVEPLADLGPWSGDLGEDPAVAKEDQGRPELHAERATQRFARSVLDLQVLDLGVLGEQRGQAGGKGLAMAAPGCAEFETRRGQQWSISSRVGSGSRSSRLSTGSVGPS